MTATSRRGAFALAVLILSGVCLGADEGMWTFDNPPRALIKERYGFEVTDVFLEHLRLASARLEGGSASFVSPDGLLFTNQHVGQGQVAKLSTTERDLVRHGFLAARREDELRCPDVEVRVLVSYEDVTGRVQSSVPATASDSDVAARRRAAMAAIEKESTDRTGLRSEVVTLYSGGEYWLYRFKTYTDARLVFAPEEQIAFFGGDYDNFTYPRYNLDITFFRVYENGVPASTPHYLRWSASGPAAGDLVFVSGFPGATSRLLTVAQLHHHRDVGNPLQMRVWTARRDALAAFARTGPEQARRAAPGLRGLENSIKRLVGQQAGLENPRVMQRKEEQERELRQRVAANPEWQAAYGAAWDEIAKAFGALPEKAPRLAFSNLTASRMAGMASTLVRYADQTAKPNAERYPEFRDARLESVRFNLLSPAPVYPDLDEAALAAWLDEVRRALGPDDPFVRTALGTSSPAEVAQRAVRGSRLGNAEFRKSLLEGGASAIQASADPLLVLARNVEPVIRDLRAWQEAHVQDVETRAGTHIARARFAAYGKNVYPDANSQLRLGFGRVLGYEEDTTRVPWKTTFFGLYERAAAFDGEPPFDLPERWRNGPGRIDLAVPLNFVNTADTIGGNSGSPMVNRAGEIVGINFDSNIQKLPNRYAYIEEDEGSRAVAVHTAGIIEALAKMYGADALVKELLGR